MPAPEHRHKLGEGGQGVVYEGMMLGMHVAIKRFKDPNRGKTEAAALALFQGPGTVPLVGITRDGQGRITEVVTKHANMGPGHRRTALGNFQSLRDLLRCMGRGGVGALLRMHERGWIHRDIKPNNFVFHRTHNNEGEQIECWLIDFGHARPMQADGYYMGGQGSKPFAKRQKWSDNLGERAYTPWDTTDDIHALGITLLYMACGVHWNDVQVFWTQAAEKVGKGSLQKQHAVTFLAQEIVKQRMMRKWNNPVSVDVRKDMQDAACMFLKCCPYNHLCRDIAGTQPSLSSIVSFLTQ